MKYEIRIKSSGFTVLILRFNWLLLGIYGNMPTFVHTLAEAYFTNKWTMVAIIMGTLNHNFNI